MPLTESQIAIRRTGITATDLSAILGINPWRSPLAVALEKWGEAPPFVANEDIERGEELEPSIRRWYARRTGKPVIGCRTVVSQKNPLVIATPDGIVNPDDDAARHILEIKCPRSSRGWGEEGTDEVPDHILPQGHWQMAALDLGRVDFALFTEGRLSIYTATRDMELEGRLIEAAERFWRDYVLPKKPPTAGAADLDWLKERFPAHKQDDYLEASPSDPGPLQDFLTAHASREQWEKVEKGARARLEQMIGTASGVRWEGGRVDWRKNKDGQATDWKAAIQEVRNVLELRASNGDGGAVQLLSELNGAVARHTGEKPGSRPFRLFQKGG